MGGHISRRSDFADFIAFTPRACKNMLFSKTIDDGQRVAVWSNNGKVTIVDGPEAHRHLHEAASNTSARTTPTTPPTSEVTPEDGSAEIMPGPVALFEDPVLHQHIRVKPAMLVDA